MIRSIDILTSSGDLHKLPLVDRRGSGLAFVKIDGLGPVKASIFVTNYGSRAGGYYNGSRTGARNIVFTIRPMDDSIEAKRFLAYRIFEVEDTITMVFRTDQGNFRTIGHVESFEPDIFSEHEQFVVSVLCPDPYFTDEAERSVSIGNLTNSNATFEFPFENPLWAADIVFGEVLPENRNAIYYSGNAPTGMDLTINILRAPGTYIEIETDRGEYLKIQNTNNFMSQGRTLHIRTEVGDRLAEVTGTNYRSDVTWLLYEYSAWPTLRPGQNFVTIRAQNTGTGILRSSISYRNRYRGI